ncbi:MAG TPA: hypothetical protein VKH42_17100 [Vicinamibacterales bacterium]|nr:hypothetical protein [Vicinamibacterales bacterium]
MTIHLRASRFGGPFVLAAGLIAAVTVATAGPKFYDDDPIARTPERKSAAGAKPLGIELFFEYSYNLFVTAKRKPTNTRAGNVNTTDEVPDSSWFSNRIGAVPLTAAQVARGVNSDRPPNPEKWTLLREKSAGTNPGFTAVDGNGETWFLQFDAVKYPEGSTGAVEVATKLFWALGYNQVETFITKFDRAHATIDPKATVRRPSGERTPFTEDDITRVLEKAARNADGSYRASAGRTLPGKILGAFRYQGTRTDDPNDLVPHEHRRELRALRVFGAWTNLVDWKAGNTLDILAEENGVPIVKHYLQDVGSTFGMANNEHEWDMGWEYYYDGRATKRRFLSYGFALSPWQTVPYQEYPSLNIYEGDVFDPTTWKPQTPVAPYIEMRADDAFWAARKVMGFSDELIRAAVHTGGYTDAAAEAHLIAVLIKRRDAIGRAYLPAITPVVEPTLDANGTLTFGNAAVSAGFAEAPRAYRAVWSRFDNATSTTTPIGRTESATASVAAPQGLPTAAGAYIEIDITADSPGNPSWQQPVKTYFRNTGGGWKLVGLERLP